MKNKSKEKRIEKHSNGLLRFLKILFLVIAILCLVLAALFTTIEIGVTVFNIILGALMIMLSNKYKRELSRRKEMTPTRIKHKQTYEEPILEAQRETLSTVPESREKEPNIPETKTERHKIAGTSFKQNDIESLGEENECYSWTKKELVELHMDEENIYRLNFPDGPVEIIPEPENKYAKSAMKVLVNGVHIGYIKKGSCTHVKKLIDENRIIGIYADISGGKYKRVYVDYDDIEDKEIYDIERDKTDYFASIYITIKER